MNALAFFEPMVRSGGSWVIWLLVGASVVILALIVERELILMKERGDLNFFKKTVGPLLQKESLDRALAACEKNRAAGSMIQGALSRWKTGASAVEETLAGFRLEVKLRLERRLWVLGTLGNNAPFIGLFGTVLGVIKAFADLSSGGQGGPEVVMGGLSEALIATAAGLLVAIPAVLAYNYFMKRVSDLLVEWDVMSRHLMAALKEK